MKKLHNSGKCKMQMLIQVNLEANKYILKSIGLYTYIHTV